MADEKDIRADDKTVLDPTGEEPEEKSEGDKTPPSQFNPYFVIVDGPRQGTRFQLKSGENSMGRSATGAVMLEDQSVSRQHAVLARGADGWVIRDVGSKNGTSVNGNKITGPVNIGHGDVVQIGIYGIRLITKPVKQEEELAPIPEPAEGKTIMVGASGPSDQHGETRTIATARADGGEELSTEGRLAEEAGEGPTGEREGEGPEEGADVKEPKEAPERKVHPIFTYGAMILSIIAVAAAAGYAYWKFTSQPPEVVDETTEPKVVTQKVIPRKTSVPVFLDFASSPLPARVTMDGKDYGLTPIKVNVELEPGKIYLAQGQFVLDELGDIKNVEVSFNVDENSNLVPILFKGPIGIIKTTTIPRDTQFYLEGYYTEDPSKARTAKISDVIFGKPIYVPYGKYVIELRQPKQVGESNQYIEDIRFRREVNISEDNPLFEIDVADADLELFPVDIKSVPNKASVFIDGKKVGETPYEGTFPLGEHTMTLRKEGYFEHTQGLKMDINTLYRVEISMKTTVAGEHINAGQNLLIKGILKDAIIELSEVFKSSPTEAEVAQTQYLLGNCYLRSGDLATAKSYFEKARTHEDFKYPAMIGLAGTYAANREMDQALPILVEVMLKATNEEIKKDAYTIFKQVSPLRSVVYIYSDPVGATVMVNDREIAQKTPVILHDLGLGNYKLKIKKDGYEPQDLSVNLSVSEFNPIIIKLKPLLE